MLAFAPRYAQIHGRVNVRTYVRVQQLALRRVAFRKTACARRDATRRACILSISLSQEAHRHPPASLKLRFKRLATLCRPGTEMESQLIVTSLLLSLHLTLSIFYLGILNTLIPLVIAPIHIMSQNVTIYVTFFTCARDK